MMARFRVPARQAIRPDPAAAAREAGFAAVRAHPVFGPLVKRARPHATDTWGMRSSALKRGGLVAVDAHGGVMYDARAKAEVGEWIWSLSHVLSHLGFGHADPSHRDGRGSYTPEWRAACCVVVDRFLAALHITGSRPLPPGFDGDEEGLAHRFATHGIPAFLAGGGPAGGGPDLWEDLSANMRSRPPTAPSTWGRTFAIGLAAFDGVEIGSRPGRPGSPAVAGLCASSAEREVLALMPPRAAREAQLAAWFGEHFPSRPFGVVVGPSGSMDEHLLGRALGAVASYATARDVGSLRVALCGTEAHDAGWLSPTELAGQAMLGGEGATVLQPGVDLLLRDPQFPHDGPILLITDGRCDQVRLRREHGWLTSGRLPFTPLGPVFHLS